jgi:hypothetical protein
MSEIYSKEDHEKYRERVEAEAAKKEQARRLSLEKHAAKQAWERIGAPGDFEKFFEENREALRKDALTQAMADTARDARAYGRSISRI